MTQVISVLRRGVLHHFSDRRLTLKSGGAVHDERSNKSLIVSLPGALGVIAYSGDSRIGRHLTDDWLAGAACSDVTAGWQPANAPGLHGLDPGLICQRLAGHLDRFAQQLPPTQRIALDLRIQFVGYYLRRRRRAAPFIFEVSTIAKRDSVTSKFRRDNGETILREQVVYTPMPPATEREAHATALVIARDSERAVWDANCEAMRRASHRSTVGEATLGIRLCPHIRPAVELVFMDHPDGPDRARAGHLTSAVSYLPWILTPHAVSAPSVVSMSAMRIGGLDIAVHGLPAAGVPFAGVVQHQDRRPSTQPATELAESSRSRDLRVAKDMFDSLERITVRHGVALRSGGTGEAELSACAAELPRPDTDEYRSLVQEIEQLPFRVLLYDSASEVVLASGEWSSEERTQRTEVMQRAALSSAAVDQVFRLNREIKEMLGVEVRADISSCEPDARLLFEITASGAAANLRVRDALRRLCALADVQHTTLRLSAELAAMHAATNSSGPFTWTPEDLGFVATRHPSEPYRRLPVVAEDSPAE